MTHTQRYDRIVRIVEDYLSRFESERNRLTSLEEHLHSARSDDILSRHCVQGHITASVAIISIRDRQVLVVLHRKLSRWVFPGGHLENDEMPWEGAAREVREETGIPTVFDAERRAAMDRSNLA